jgi:hypothetical protein
VGEGQDESAVVRRKTESEVAGGAKQLSIVNGEWSTPNDSQKCIGALSWDLIYQIPEESHVSSTEIRSRLLATEGVRRKTGNDASGGANQWSIVNGKWSTPNDSQKCIGALGRELIYQIPERSNVTYTRMPSSRRWAALLLNCSNETAELD